MGKIVSIINPKAGGFNDLVETCINFNVDKIFPEHEIVYTTQVHSGITEKLINTNLEQIIKDYASNGIRNFNICGGDGHIGEVIDAIMKLGINSNEFSISVLPIGSGNDFAFGGLGIKDIQQGLDSLNNYYRKGNKNIKEVDLFRTEVKLDDESTFSRYGINSADVSFGAFLLNFMENTAIGRKAKKMFGGKSYTYLSPLVSLLYKSPDLKIDINGWTKVESIENFGNYPINSQNSLMDNSEKRVLINRIIHSRKNFLTCWQNSEYTGGGLRLCPGAKIDDDVFDFFIHERTFRPKFPFSLMLKAKKGEVLEDPYVSRVWDVKKVEISANNGNLGRYLNVDGELYNFTSPIKKVKYEGTGEKLRFICDK